MEGIYKNYLFIYLRFFNQKSYSASQSQMIKHSTPILSIGHPK